MYAFFFLCILGVHCLREFSDVKLALQQSPYFDTFKDFSLEYSVCFSQGHYNQGSYLSDLAALSECTDPLAFPAKRASNVIFGSIFQRNFVSAYPDLFLQVSILMDKKPDLVALFNDQYLENYDGVLRSMAVRGGTTQTRALKSLNLLSSEDIVFFQRLYLFNLACGFGRTVPWMTLNGNPIDVNVEMTGVLDREEGFAYIHELVLSSFQGLIAREQSPESKLKLEVIHGVMRRASSALAFAFKKDIGGVDYPVTGYYDIYTQFERSAFLPQSNGHIVTAVFDNEYLYIRDESLEFVGSVSRFKTRTPGKLKREEFEFLFKNQFRLGPILSFYAPVRLEFSPIWHTSPQPDGTCSFNSFTSIAKILLNLDEFEFDKYYKRMTTDIMINAHQQLQVSAVSKEHQKLVQEAVKYALQRSPERLEIFPGHDLREVEPYTAETSRNRRLLILVAGTIASVSNKEYIRRLLGKYSKSLSFVQMRANAYSYNMYSGDLVAGILWNLRNSKTYTLDSGNLTIEDSAQETKEIIPWSVLYEQYRNLTLDEKSAIRNRFKSKNGLFAPTLLHHIWLTIPKIDSQQFDMFWDLSFSSIKDYFQFSETLGPVPGLDPNTCSAQTLLHYTLIMVTNGNIPDWVPVCFRRLLEHADTHPELIEGAWQHLGYPLAYTVPMLWRKSKHQEFELPVYENAVFYPGQKVGQVWYVGVAREFGRKIKLLGKPEFGRIVREYEELEAFYSRAYLVIVCVFPGVLCVLLYFGYSRCMVLEKRKKTRKQLYSQLAQILSVN